MLHLRVEYSIFVVGMRHVENQAGRKANILKLGPRFFKKILYLSRTECITFCMDDGRFAPVAVSG